MPVPNLKREYVEDILRRRHVSSIELTELPSGEESRVYLLVEDGSKRVLRVNRSRIGFEKDEFAYRHFHSTSLPIPAVLEIDDLDGENSFCTTSYIAGTTLQDLSEDELQQTLQPTEDVMRSLRESDISATRGYGFLDQHGVGSHSSWSSFLQSTGDLEWPDISHVVDTSPLRAAFRKLLCLSDEVQELRCLIHGDFGSNNVLTNRVLTDGPANGRYIAAVIDWSEAMIGDPMYEVANIFFWRPWLRCMEDLAKSFEGKLYLDENAQNRLLCYQLHIGLREVREGAIVKNWDEASWAMARLQTLLRQA